VFTNPPGDSAGRLIDAAGGKNLRVRSAEVSAKHANFIQVDPGGSANDVRELMTQIVELVATDAQVELIPETRMVGFG
jgi:UDP-N-acetylmuramate dehydrogenase